MKVNENRRIGFGFGAIILSSHLDNSILDYENLRGERSYRMNVFSVKSLKETSQA